ncbi:hypothetical protein FRC01_013859 [Tulasnella sp. 417]|nr:hypothetical protein FRC01_013859 [Tulasnella sp. 417]
MVEIIRGTGEQVGAVSTPGIEENTSLAVELRPWVVAPQPSEADVEELRRQRMACGWGADRIPIWEQEIRNGTRYIWFVHAREPSGRTEIAGMISLDLFNSSDPSLANFRAPGSLAGDRVEVCLAYVYPKFRRRGFWELMVQAAEDTAAELGAKIATGNTMSLHPKVRMYEKRGCQRYKPPEKIYDLKEMEALGFGEEHCYAAFFEKRIYPPRQYRL